MARKDAKIKFEVGQTYRTHLNGMWIGDQRKIHITHVLQGLHPDEQLIIFKYWGKRAQYWHQERASKGFKDHQEAIDNAK